MYVRDNPNVRSPFDDTCLGDDYLRSRHHDANKRLYADLRVIRRNPKVAEVINKVEQLCPILTNAA